MTYQMHLPGKGTFSASLSAPGTQLSCTLVLWGVQEIVRYSLKNGKANPRGGCGHTGTKYPPCSTCLLHSAQVSSLARGQETSRAWSTAEQVLPKCSSLWGTGSERVPGVEVKGRTNWNDVLLHVVVRFDYCSPSLGKQLHFNLFCTFNGQLLWRILWWLWFSQKNNVYWAKGTNKINIYGLNLYKYLSSETHWNTRQENSKKHQVGL